ncbi:CAAD domain-containing protein [Phormidium yuhuli AB48]|uniref:CAAD domain-containing protein n=1 Tax=Phormidium yuhuli AB48 TaxID=2940671 RepID=A0ABY5ASV6_9CYAN|nr:CAAD domain-containing protein [Phormidium yuhuli]USR91421.1 CAAD domain-containing protein [Phormidium yuhuli AB48]
MTSDTTPNGEQTTSPDQPAAAVESKGGELQISNSPANAGNKDQFDQVKTQVLSVLSDLFGIVGHFFSEYKKPLINVTLVMAALITLYLTLSVIDAVNDIPLLSPVFELVGIGYSGWFVFRFLLTADARKELQNKIANFVNRVTGS